MAEEQRDQQPSIPRPSQAEGDRQTAEESTGDATNPQQTKRERQSGTGSGTIPRPSQAEGDRTDDSDR